MTDDGPSDATRYESLSCAAKLAHLVEDCRSWPESTQHTLKNLLRASIVEGGDDRRSNGMTDALQWLIDEYSNQESRREIIWFLERSSFKSRLLSKFPELAPDVAEAIISHAEGCRSWCRDDDLKCCIIQDGSVSDFVAMLVDYHSSLNNRLASNRIFPGASAQFKEQAIKSLLSPELEPRVWAQYIGFISDIAEIIISQAKERGSWPDFLVKWIHSLRASGCGLEEVMAALVEYHSTVNDGSFLNQVLVGASEDFKEKVVEALSGPSLRGKINAKFPELRNIEDRNKRLWTCTECGFECRATVLVCEFCDTRRGKGYVACAQGTHINIFDQAEFKSSSSTFSSSDDHCIENYAGSQLQAALSTSRPQTSEAHRWSTNIKQMSMCEAAKIACPFAKVYNHNDSSSSLIAYLPVGMEVTSSSMSFSSEEIHQGWAQLMHPLHGWIQRCDLHPLRLMGSSTSKTSPDVEMFALMQQTRQWMGTSPRHKCIVSTRRLLDTLLEREQSGSLLKRLGHGSCQEVNGSFLGEERRRPWWPAAYKCWVPHTFLGFADGSIADLTADQWSSDSPQLCWPADAHRYSWSREEADEASAIRYNFGKEKWKQLEEQDNFAGVWRTICKWKEIEKIACESAACLQAWQISFQHMASGPDDGLRLQDVVLALWVTGGYLPEQSRSNLADLMDFARMHGVHDAVFCDHPGGYPIPGEGHDAFPQYIDTLVTEIDREPRRNGRPLVLFAQGWGSTHALALAERLGPRVLKVYILGRGPLLPGGLPSFWDECSQHLKQGGESSTLEYLKFCNPGNLLFERACSASRPQLQKMFDESPWFERTVNHARLAFRDGIYPDMSRDVRIISCPLCVITALLDPLCSPDLNISWILWTTGDYQAVSIDGDHYDCLKPRKQKGSITGFPLGYFLIDDMVKSLRNVRWENLRTQMSSYFQV